MKCSRQACAEKLTILPDGSIPQVEVTSCGLNEGPLPGKGKYEERIACNLSGKDGTVKSVEARKKDKKNLLPYFTQSGEDREENEDQYIANLRSGAWRGCKYFAFDGTESQISVTVSGQAEGTLKVFTNRNSLPVSSVRICKSEAWDTSTESLSLPAGPRLCISYTKVRGVWILKNLRLINNVVLK